MFCRTFPALRRLTLRELAPRPANEAKVWRCVDSVDSKPETGRVFRVRARVARRRQGWMKLTRQSVADVGLFAKTSIT